MGFRSVTVEVPDDDQAEANVRRLAAGMREGFDPIVLRRPAGIPDEEMPAVFNYLAGILQVRVEINRHLDSDAVQDSAAVSTS